MSPSEPGAPPSLWRLGALKSGTRGVVVRVDEAEPQLTHRLAAMGVTPGARIRVLQTFPGIVFECDQTELAVERAVARSVFIVVDETTEPGEGTRSR